MRTKDSKTYKPCAIDSVNNCFFYFITGGRFAIADLGYCQSSEHTIDMKFYDLANNEALLHLLNLWYIRGNYGQTFTYESRAEWFCGYISAFVNDSERSSKMYKKALTNPTIRLLIEDNDLLKEVKSCC